MLGTGNTLAHETKVVCALVDLLFQRDGVDTRVLGAETLYLGPKGRRMVQWKEENRS